MMSDFDMFKPFLHDDVRMFRLAELEQAKDWIKVGASNE